MPGRCSTRGALSGACAMPATTSRKRTSSAAATRSPNRRRLSFAISCRSRAARFVNSTFISGERAKRRFNVLLAGDPATLGLIERTELVSSRSVDAAAACLDLAHHLGEFFLVLLWPRGQALNDLFDGHTHIGAMTRLAIWTFNVLVA